MRYYVGIKGGRQREVFRSDATPTKETHKQYLYVIGPFSTRRAAKYMAGPGYNNPHCVTTADAKRLSMGTKTEIEGVYMCGSLH